MSNQWFQFKQFRIAQDHCGMKVTTDACIQGAWTPASITTRNILDIGTGTGLLALMIAQRATSAHIHGIELDLTAAQQAAYNAANSPWGQRISITCNDIREVQLDTRFDLIICNPPFFSASLLGPQTNRNHARHDLQLTARELLSTSAKLVTPDGFISLLYPWTDHQSWTQIAADFGLSVYAALEVSPYVHKTPNRMVTLFTHATNATPSIEQLSIRNVDGSYTAAFTNLLKDYYLHL